MEEFESLELLVNYIQDRNKVIKIAVQSLDITSIESLIISREFVDCIFLGCEMTKKTQDYVIHENYVFPSLNVPYNIYPNKLYNKESLFDLFDYRTPASYSNTLDKRIYDHYLKLGKEATQLKETLARRLHDHSITNALTDLLESYDERRVVAIMGGHNMGRDTHSYRQVVELARTLTQDGYLMLSGGGPGAMEATHVGAWFADKPIEVLDEVIEILKKAPKYNHVDWLSTAFRVLEKYPTSSYKSLGIPTWFYGHEPPTPFASHIAKYFANSVREDGLLAIAKGGVIFSPGNAGTIQEIFQDVAQNHYESFGYASPMIFLNKEYWSYDRPIYPILELMQLRGNLNHLDIRLYDKNDDIVQHLKRFYN